MKYCTLGHDGVSGKAKRVRMLLCGSTSHGCTHINAQSTSMVRIQQGHREPRLGAASQGLSACPERENTQSQQQEGEVI